MAKQKIVLMPPAELERRDSDLRLPAEKFLKLSFFSRMKKKPSVDKFPGTLALRRLRQGEVICRQGEAGWTAFYLLTGTDVRTALQARLEVAADAREMQDLQQALARLEQEQTSSGTAQAVATVHLAIARPPQPGERGLLRRLSLAVLGGPRRTAERQPLHIPIDAPTDVSYDSRQATLYEGDLFGEMSCMYGTPRSATIVADRDCYTLEMLRNILDQVQKDEGSRAEMEKVYKERILQNHLRRLSIFSDLTEEQFARIRESVELVRCDAGALICDEHERSDCMYIIRSGLVKVVKECSALLALGDVPDWPVLCAQLREGQPQAEARQQVWQRLPEAIRAVVSRATGPETPAERAAVVQALNEIIVDTQLPDGPGLKELAAGATFRERLPGLPALRKNWSVQQLRQANRVLLELTCAGELRALPARSGPERILAYRSRGEFIGEIGLMTRQPRSATCIAYVHPEPQSTHQAQGVAPWRKDDADRVELVRISEKLFWELLDASPTIRAKVEQEVARRQKGDVERLRASMWDESTQPLLSGRFEELGLVQGQRLMLIDLDRCTRCDECVRACVETHDDGRSRLFLDGPRFGKYLVPSTCRSCLDPVCMIGCPVGSIHRGDNGQIEIENWCIGCELCARNCPYGSIQMHDIGLIPANAHGWRFLPAALCTDARWTGRNFADSRWPAGPAPFRRDGSFRETLAAHQPANGGPVQEVCFRYVFQVDARVIHAAERFRLEVTSVDGKATVWVNGREMRTEEKPKRGKLEYALPTTQKVLQAGKNVVAVKALLPEKDGDLVLELRLDEVRTVGVPLGMTGDMDISEKPVTDRAVVCDLCSAQYGQRPACVTACPHDAAMRVDARFEFPV